MLCALWNRKKTNYEPGSFGIQLAGRSVAGWWACLCLMNVVVLAGRSNVGKSTLFNRLTQTRDALVANTPGLTRDRRYGEVRLGDCPITLVDTPGLAEVVDDPLAEEMSAQCWRAIADADVVVQVCDAREGLLPADEDIITALRRTGKPTLLVVNKVDRQDEHLAIADFAKLGLGVPLAVSAAHGRGMFQLCERITDLMPVPAEDGGIAAAEAPPESVVDAAIPVAIVGRPNVGKSTLINHLLGEARVLVSEIAGTTHDNVDIPFQRASRSYVLIDTAGIRRPGKVEEIVEKFSIARSLQAIRQAQVAVLIIDAGDGLVAQDLRLLNRALSTGGSLVLAVNKWDQAGEAERSHIKNQLDRRLSFARFVDICFISALKGRGIDRLFRLIDKVQANTTRALKTNELNTILAELVRHHPPPMGRGGRRIKLRYAHSGGTAPPVVVIHGNQVEALPEAYRTYLESGFREALHLEGTPIRLEFRQGDNPYADRKNKLTPRQIKRRARLVSHGKKRAQKK